MNVLVAVLAIVAAAVVGWLGWSLRPWQRPSARARLVLAAAPLPQADAGEAGQANGEEGVR